ncbi:hypothetical protein IG631_16996 [Alternaria alternata]|nr:hypothetical protein IG631_16996 [Alternaria alternata]
MFHRYVGACSVVSVSFFVVMRRAVDLGARQSTSLSVCGATLLVCGDHNKCEPTAVSDRQRFGKKEPDVDCKWSKQSIRVQLCSMVSGCTIADFQATAAREWVKSVECGVNTRRLSD